MAPTPHYLLFSEASCSSGYQSWRFVLQNVETSRRMVVSDGEPTTCGERLELLAVVRGLEALDGPARVTLVTRSRYVSRGIRLGITEWRANEWRWERFGRVVPVKDCDLWQRVDRALLFHQVECQAWQFEEAVTDEPLSCRESNAGIAQVKAPRLVGAASRCSEIGPNPCEPVPTPRVSSLLGRPGRLAPTKRRLAAKPRQVSQRSRGQRRVKPSFANIGGSMIATAAVLRESLRLLGHPVRHLVPGAA